MQKETGTTISIEEVDDTGVIEILAKDQTGADAATRRIKEITTMPEVGEVYDAKVVGIQSYGAFVEFLPGQQGLLHISEIEWRRLTNVEDVLKEGQMIQVKLLDIDKKSGKFKLSRKVLLEKPEPQAAE